MEARHQCNPADNTGVFEGHERKPNKRSFDCDHFIDGAGRGLILVSVVLTLTF